MMHGNTNIKDPSMLKDSSVFFIFRVRQQYCLILKMKTLQSFNMLATVYSLTA